MRYKHSSLFSLAVSDEEKSLPHRLTKCKIFHFNFLLVVSFGSKFRNRESDLFSKKFQQESLFLAKDWGQSWPLLVPDIVQLEKN
jgi:hypothetical protein